MSADCCGVTPRFNWVLATCHHSEANRTSSACFHAGASATAMDINYLAAYQFNGSHWVKDAAASVHPSDPWALANFTPFTLHHNSSGQDWDLKYAPTSSRTGSQGLGPPAMMFVMSTRRFAWSSLYVLNQLTINRGPDSLHNCWGSSSGEFDLLEPPFWYDTQLPNDRLYTTSNADSGRCLPAQQELSRTFYRNCSNVRCCEMCACSSGHQCFGNPADVGFQPMGCTNTTPPEGENIFEVENDVTLCSNFSGGVMGGRDASGFFSFCPETGKTSRSRKRLGNHTPCAAAKAPYLYAAVIDRDGSFVYRWQHDEDHPLWPGISYFFSDDVLSAVRPVRKVNFNPPCNDPETPCGIYEPSCIGDCPVVMNPGPPWGDGQRAGPYAAEAAKIGLNWWEHFTSTDQLKIEEGEIPDPASVPVHVHVAKPTCSKACSKSWCDNLPCSSAAPFLCTRGRNGVSGGCQVNSTAWPADSDCLDCCDARTCMFSCTTCPSILDHNCSETFPFLCTSGPSVGGCNNVSWGQLPQACHSCCRVHPNAGVAIDDDGEGFLISGLQLLLCALFILSVAVFVVDALKRL